MDIDKIKIFEKHTETDEKLEYAESHFSSRLFKCQRSRTNVHGIYEQVCTYFSYSNVSKHGIYTHRKERNDKRIYFFHTGMYWVLKFGMLVGKASKQMKDQKKMART